jgi:sarcosine oxidase
MHRHDQLVTRDVGYSMPKRVAIVGAGIVGLATASELIRAGAGVRLYEKAAVGGAQSKGSTRIFRQAHGDPRLVELAMRARRKWRHWEERFGRRLIGHEGLIVSGADIVPEWEAAMFAAGAPHRRLTEEECRDRLPVGRLPSVPALLDPEGGATRVRRTIELLRAEIGARLRMAEVTAIETRGSGCVVHTAEGDWACDEVVLTAGVDTGEIARSVGLEMPVEVRQHSRFTFEIREQYRNRPQSCWIDDSGTVGDGWHSFGQPVGTTGRYAVGVSWEEQRCSVDVGADTVSRESLEVARQYVRAVLPGLDPEPVDEIRCTFFECAFLDRIGDGFAALRRDGITVFYGNNLFKFAPLLGELLANGAMHGVLPTELAMPAASR